jgi:hypothetical protein
MDAPPPDVGNHIDEIANELTHQALCKGKTFMPSFLPLSYAVDDADGLDLQRVSLPVNPRYSLVVFADASFAVGATKERCSPGIFGVLPGFCHIPVTV